jgi:glutamate/tyrosine decarboxylase-like PLP-dependent enzyme
MSDESKQLLKDVWGAVLDGYFDERETVFDFQTPEALENLMDFSLPFERDGDSDTATALQELLNQVIVYSPWARHPGFLNYLYSTPDPIGLLGDWMISLVNSNVHAYEASPVFTLSEVELIGSLNAVVGYDEHSSGIFCPGGSYSNMLAMYLARERYQKSNGVRGDELAILTSAQGHYSIDNAARMLGIRRENLLKVDCDERGRLVPEDLRRRLQEAITRGKHPFFVCATSGTTVLGAFDPLEEIRDVLGSDERVWLHVDAAWGGAVLMSRAHRPLMAGVEAADSLTWDFHKASGAPIFCSALLVKDRSTLEHAFDEEGSYLFHDAGGDGDHDLGRRTAQCGRRGDAFKLWLMWKMYGQSHFSDLVSRAFQVRSSTLEMLKERDCFALYHENPDFLNIGFWYVPKACRPCHDIREVPESQEISLLTERLYACLKRDGRAMVNYARLPGRPAFLRLVLSNPNVDDGSVASLLDIVESLGDMLSLPLEDLLISGGDERLDLDDCGLNYTFTSPTPRPGQVVRSSCTSAPLTLDQQTRAQALLDELRDAKLSFKACMDAVHDRMRKILAVDESVSIISTPSGTDSEYIPLLIAKILAGAGSRVISVITGAGEIGTSSATAAAGRYFKSTTPIGSQVEKEEVLAGFEDVTVIEVRQRDPETGRPSPQTEVWTDHVKQSLKQPDALVLLHILESSKLGYRLEEMEKIDDLLSTYKNRLLVVVDACQSRTDISRVRIFLKLGCMVMITGSKFEEGPPYSGAVIVPPQVIEHLSQSDFRNFPQDLANFITVHDVSGPLSMLESYLPSWMNWGLMLRWTLALDNWQAYRNIDEAVRNRLVREWARGLLLLLERYPCLAMLGGGEHQPGSVGDTNTIISIKLRSDGRELQMEELRKVYRWMAEDMSTSLPDSVSLSDAEKAVLRSSFLMGQPVSLGRVAVLRIALGARLVIEMDAVGVEEVLEMDDRLLSKLSILTTRFKEIDTLA